MMSIKYSYSNMSYTDGKIYKLVSKQTDKIYIGSTKRELEVRFNCHKSETKNCSSKKMLNYADCEIVLIENYPCNSRTELELREGELQLQSIDVIVNKNIAGRTKEKYYLDNRERFVQQRAQYYADNTDKIAQYRLDNQEKIAQYDAQYRSDNKDKIAKQRAQHRLDNAEKIAKQRAQYRLDNKEKIAKQCAQRRLNKKLSIKVVE